VFPKKLILHRYHADIIMGIKDFVKLLQGLNVGEKRGEHQFAPTGNKVNYSDV